MKSFRRKLQYFIKSFFYKIFILIHGKIDGVIKLEEDERIKVKKTSFDNKNYKIYIIDEGRLYTDRINDTAVILDNKIIEGPSFQLRYVDNLIKNSISHDNTVFKKGTARIKNKIKGSVLSLLTGGAGNENYFHWLFDVLPRLEIISQAIDLKKIDYYLFPNLKKNFQIQTLNELKIPFNKRLSSETCRHIQAENLILSDHPYVLENNPTKEIQEIPLWISNWLKKSFIKEVKNLKKISKRFYIDRQDSYTSKQNLRVIINENELKQFLLKENFEIIKLTEFNFLEQVELFNNAEFIIGLHGAGFANLAFCKKNTKILELKSLSAPKTFENIALKNNLYYQSIAAKTIYGDQNNQQGNIEIPIELLKERLLR